MATLAHSLGDPKTMSFDPNKRRLCNRSQTIQAALPDAHGAADPMGLKMLVANRDAEQSLWQLLQGITAQALVT